MRVPCSHTALCPRSHTNPPHGTHPFARARAARSPALRALARVPTTRIRTGTPCAPCTCFPEPHAATQPDCIRRYCWARSPAAAPVPEYTPRLPNWQYSSSLRKADDAPEKALIGRRKRPRFSACALPLSPPRPFTERKRWNGFFSTGRSFLPKIKTALLKLFFQGKSLVSRLSGS